MKKEIFIFGRVHGVSYRPFLLYVAESLGSERFCADNVTVDDKQAVHVLIEGDDARVARFIEFIKQRRPSGAEVEEVVERDFDGFVPSIEGYYRYLTALQLSKIVDSGISLNRKVDKIERGIGELRSDLAHFMGRVENRFDEVMRKYGEISEKLTTILETLVRESKETRDMLNRNLELLKKAIDKLSSK